MENPIKYRTFGVEVRALWSNEKSYFSLKRIERTIMFLCAVIPQTWYIFANIYTLSAFELSALVIPFLVAIGYSIKLTEKEKNNEIKS